MTRRFGDYFVGKTIVITGAASGIGRATALLMARQGANVVCADVQDVQGKETADLVNSHGGKGLFVHCDVTRRPDLKNMFQQAIGQFGGVQFLLNSAGSAMRRSKFLDIDEDLLDRTFDLNFKGTFNAIQEILPHMLEHGHGVIVNIASMSVKRGGPGASIHYAAAKGAVNTLTLGVAREFANQGIRCLSVSPGPIDTAFQASSNTSKEMAEKWLADIPMGRMGQASEIAELILFMCSNVCEFMTADTVYVNGGGGYK